jgi:hypothetical protein
MTTQTPPTHAAPPPPKPKGRLLLGLGILVAFVVVYALSLFGFHLLGESAAPIKAPDLNAADDTVVLVRVEELKTVANRLGVKVLVYPQEAMWDSRLDVLKQDTAVRMDPPNDLGDLVYPAGKSPAQVATTVEAHGDPEIWPFDSYETDTLSADVLVGTGDDRKYKPARIEVAGKLEGWDISVQRVGDGGDSVIITLQRSKAPLIFDLGICLVLFALASIALAVVIPMMLGKRKLVPPFGGWFAALLFAVIPIRNFLPGAPPPGAWIDQVLVIWVLIALVGAMGIYMYTWYKRSD